MTSYTPKGVTSKKPHGETAGGVRRPTRVSTLAPPHPSTRIPLLQQTLGNQGVLRRMESGLRVNDVNNLAEKEADRVAEAVMAGPGAAVGPVANTTPSAPAVQRKCAACKEEEGIHIQRKETSPAQPTSAPPIVGQVLNTPGRPLDHTAGEFMRSGFGHDFSGVRIHTGALATESARAVGARAYTVGRDIVFDSSEYSTATADGRRLLAHELTHVLQQQTGVHRVQRSPNPARSAPVQSLNPLSALFPDVSPEVSKRFSVRAFKESEFEALSGIKASSLTEKRLLSPGEAGLDSESGPGAGAGIAAGVLFGPRPTLPLPLGSTGVLWSADAHLSQFAVVRQNNPALAFFFGDTTIDAYGFRANAATHFGAAGERLFDTSGGPLTARLNRGAPGTYINDAIFPYLPLKGGSVAVYGQSGAENLPGAEDLVGCMARASKSGQLKGTYRFSTPDRKSPAFDRAFGEGAAADPDFEPPEIVNCLNEANATSLTRQALQGRDLTYKLNGRDVNVGTATYVDTGEPVPGLLPGAAKNIRAYLAQFDANPSAQGLTRKPITPGMIFRGVTGVVRVGGFVLMIYNLIGVADRYEGASEYDKPLVAGEEAALLTAGLLGSLLGEVIGETVLCVGTGPAFALCVLAAGIVGGVAGSALGEGATHDLGRTLQDAAELHREGKLLPGVLETATQVLGTDQQKKLYQEFKKAEKPEPSGGLYDLFKF